MSETCDNIDLLGCLDGTAAEEDVLKQRDPGVSLSSGSAA